MKQKNTTGFTIVELLIVVVVIAILAAVTIVAYNGITNRSKSSSAQMSAKQAATKIQAYAIENGDQYPPDLATLGLTGSESTSYQYRVNNSASPATFCVTATTQNISYFTSGGIPEPGACAGHGANGSPAVINYAKRPIPMSSATPWTGYNSAGGTSASLTPNALESSNAYRWTTSGTFSANAAIGLEYSGTALAVPAGEKITPSIYVRASKAGTYATLAEFRSASAGVSSVVGPSVSVPQNTWVRLVGNELTVPAGADRMSIRARYLSGTTWTSGDWIEITRVSTAPGAYADGNSPGWAWTGTPYESVSTGPQL